MKHLSTWDLLDLAGEYLLLKGSHAYRNAAMLKLASIDEELLSRVPEYELMTVHDFFHTEGDLDFVEFLPIGFEPYIGEDLAYDAAEWYETHDSSYF